MTQDLTAEVGAATSGRDPLVGRRVLVVGINYAPETTGIAPYTTGMAEHLAALGAKVTVVTGMPHYPQWQRAPRVRARRASARSTRTASGCCAPGTTSRPARTRCAAACSR